VWSVGSAVHAACRAVQKELLGRAQKMARSPLAGAKLDDVVFAEGKIRHKHDERREVSVADAMRAGKADRIEKEASAEPNERSRYSHLTHSAVFPEVNVDDHLALTRATPLLTP